MRENVDCARSELWMFVWTCSRAQQRLSYVRPARTDEMPKRGRYKLAVVCRRDVASRSLDRPSVIRCNNRPSMPRAAANVVRMEPTNSAKMMNWSMPWLSADWCTPSSSHEIPIVASAGAMLYGVRKHVAAIAAVLSIAALGCDGTKSPSSPSRSSTAVTAVRTRTRATKTPRVRSRATSSRTTFESFQNTTTPGNGDEPGFAFTVAPNGTLRSRLGPFGPGESGIIFRTLKEEPCG